MGKSGRVRLAIASTLLLTAVPWWARDLPPLAGLSGWVVAALALSVAYAATVAWLLQAFWDDRGDDAVDESASGAGAGAANPPAERASAEGNRLS